MLQKQVLPINFTSGLDLKTDPKLLEPGKLSTLDNAYFDVSSTLTKRDGYTALTTTTDLGSLPTATRAFTHLGSMGQISTAGQAHVYSKAAATWHSPDYVAITRVQTEPIVRNTETQTAVDAGVSGTMEVWAWEDSRGGVRATVRDSQTGVKFQSEVVLDAAGVLPRVIVRSGVFYVFFVSGTNIKVSALSVGAPLTFTTSTLKADASSTNTLIDAALSAFNNKIYIAYRDTGASGGNIAAFTYDGTTISATQATGFTGGFETMHVNVFASGDIGIIFAQHSSTGLYAFTLTAALAYISAGAGITIDTAADTVKKVTSISSGANLFILYEVTTSTGTWDCTIKQAIMSTSIVVSAASEFSRNVNLGSQLFTMNGAFAVGAVHTSTYQPTFFVIIASGPLTGTTAARCLLNRAGGVGTRNVLPSVMGSGGATVVIPAFERGKLTVSNGNDTTAVGVTRISVGDQTMAGRSFSELNKLTLIPGGVPFYFDGVGFIEAGFNTYPHDIVVAKTIVGGGGSTAGTYQYCSVLEWVDAKGNLHRSTPSLPQSVVVGNNDLMQVTIKMLGLTRASAVLRPGSSAAVRSNAKFTIYRTLSNGTVFYRVTNIIASQPANIIDQVQVSFSDGTTDAALANNEILYTTGGTLPYEPAPSCRSSCVHQNRFVVANLDSDPYGFAYSSEAVVGEAPWWNESFRGRVPTDLGVITGIASMDDKLFIFCESGSWYISGAGPLPTGQQNGYSNPQRLSSDAGCVSHRSIVQTGDGLMFHSTKGIRLLSRGLQMLPIGAPVDSIVTGVVSSLLDDSRHHVRFYTGSVVLVYDYLFKQWSRYTNHACVDAVKVDSSPTHLQSNGAACSPGGVTDNGTSIAMTVETGWLSFAGVQAFQRVWRALVVGTYQAATTLTLAIGYDYESAYNETASVATNTIGSATTPLQLRHHIVRQKCEAIRLKVTESGNSNGFGLTSMAFEVGLKQGGNKMAAAGTI